LSGGQQQRVAIDGRSRPSRCSVADNHRQISMKRPPTASGADARSGRAHRCGFLNVTHSALAATLDRQVTLHAI